MPKIKDTGLLRLHLMARALSEYALVCGYTSPTANTYPDRFARVEEAVAELVKELALEEKE